ncbi:hypothetical protein ACH41H_31800 [Streptomyces sp. NPDC020800]|uniref:hypothetical protein n=1 Tax=Streptomyces sp. NPDC020800 TaxID=3365092 RepID=UPI0037A7BEF8
MGQTGRRGEGAGPFTTRLTWPLPEGGTAVWESRPARKRGTLSVRAEGASEGRVRRADPVSLVRLGRLNSLAAVAFCVGGLLFALGAGFAQFGPGDSTTSASIYFAGGLFFNTGGYASLLQVINAPHRADHGALTASAWKWWSYEPYRIDWLSALVLFAGTLVFGVNLLDSFLRGLTVQETNRLIWAPDMIGCALFLISGHLAFGEICHGWPWPWPCLHARSLGWWIVAINQLGSWLFLVSALAAFTRPATGSLVSIGIANWGTLAGALCFAAGGILQYFERPAGTATHS